MRRTTTAAFLAVVLFASLLATHAHAQDVVTGAKDPNYKVLLENGHVRVLEVRLARGAVTTTHSHPDHTAYVVKGGTLEFTVGGEVQRVDLKSGATLFVPAETHSAKNVGKTEIVVVINELKDSAGLKAELTTFERAELGAMLETAEVETRELVARATGDLWSKKPGEGRWSVAEIVEHLGVTESLIFGGVTAALGQPIDPDWTAITAGTSMATFAGAILDRSQKFQAPEPAQPKGGMSRAEAMSKFGGARAVTMDFVRITNDPLKSHTAAGPAGKMTAHQFLALIALHNMRHNQQIAEALAQLGAK